MNSSSKAVSANQKGVLADLLSSSNAADFSGTTRLYVLANWKASVPLRCWPINLLRSLCGFLEGLLSEVGTAVDRTTARKTIGILLSLASANNVSTRSCSISAASYTAKMGSSVASKIRRKRPIVTFRIIRFSKTVGIFLCIFQASRRPTVVPPLPGQWYKLRRDVVLNFNSPSIISMRRSVWSRSAS